MKWRIEQERQRLTAQRGIVSHYFNQLVKEASHVVPWEGSTLFAIFTFGFYRSGLSSLRLCISLG